MVTQDPLARAQAGHEQAFRALTDPHRRDCWRTATGSSAR